MTDAEPQSQLAVLGSGGAERDFSGPRIVVIVNNLNYLVVVGSRRIQRTRTITIEHANVCFARTVEHCRVLLNSFDPDTSYST